MKKVLLFHWFLVGIEYTVVYLIASFIKWEFTNPFQWIIDLPKYSEGNRFLILFYFFSWQAGQIYGIKKGFEPKNEEND